MASGQRALHNDIIRQAVQFGIATQKDLQRPQGRNDDTQLGIPETWMILNQPKRIRMQPGSKCYPVNPGVQSGTKSDTQRIARGIHGQFFHAIGENQTIAPLFFHDVTDMQLRRLLNRPEIEMNFAFILNLDVILVLACFVPGEMSAEVTVSRVERHGIGNMANTAQTGCLKSQLRSGDVDAHPSDNDRYIFLSVENQPEIINTFHCYPWTTVKVRRLFLFLLDQREPKIRNCVELVHK